MTSGKPFVCWLDDGAKINAIPIYMGDMVDFEVDEGKWIQGKIGYKREGGLVVRCKSKEYSVFSRLQLRPVKDEVMVKK